MCTSGTFNSSQAGNGSGRVQVEAVWTNGALPTQKQNQKKWRVIKWRHAGPKRANQGSRVTEGGQAEEGEDEEPINSSRVASRSERWQVCSRNTSSQELISRVLIGWVSFSAPYCSHRRENEMRARREEEQGNYEDVYETDSFQMENFFLLFTVTSIVSLGPAVWDISNKLQ